MLQDEALQCPVEAYGISAFRLQHPRATGGLLGHQQQSTPPFSRLAWTPQICSEQKRSTGWEGAEERDELCGYTARKILVAFLLLLFLLSHLFYTPG